MPSLELTCYNGEKFYYMEYVYCLKLKSSIKMNIAYELIEEIILSYELQNVFNIVLKKLTKKME